MCIRDSCELLGILALTDDDGPPGPTKRPDGDPFRIRTAPAPAPFPAPDAPPDALDSALDLATFHWAIRSRRLCFRSNAAFADLRTRHSHQSDGGRTERGREDEREGGRTRDKGA